MGRAVVTERDVRQWKTRQQQMQEDLARQQREQLDELVSGYNTIRHHGLDLDVLAEVEDRSQAEDRQQEAPQEEERQQREEEDRQREEDEQLRQQQLEERQPETPFGPTEQMRDESPRPQPEAPSSLPVSAPPPPPDDYVDRLLKYIPAESVALYLTLQGIILSGAAEAPNLNTWLWFILGIGLIGTTLYQWRVLKIEKVVQLAVSTAAFGVWVFALGGAFASLSWYEPFIGSLALVIFTFFAPLISPDVLSADQE